MTKTNTAPKKARTKAVAEQVTTAAPVDVAAHTGTGLKIEPNREKQNGITRPSVGGKCRAVWDWLDAHPAATSKDVKAAATEMGWNPGNASIEFYQWRKFHGITGRAKAA